MKFIIIAGILIFVAFAILVHQFIFYGVWWEMEDLSHEGWILMFTFAGVVLLALKRG